MIREAIDRILSLRPEPCVEVLGGTYATQKLDRIVPPMAQGLKLHTLDSLVTYLAEQIDGVETEGAERFSIHVESPSVVNVLEEIFWNEGTRQRPVFAQYDTKPFPFGEKVSIEDFLVFLQARFANTTDKEKILATLGTIRAEKVTTSLDDGITQTVNRKVGAVLEDKVAIKNPVVLAPRRAFPEIQQVECPFILRLHQRESELPVVSLHEADGGEWQRTAVQRIAQYLADKGVKGVILA
jgi:hypothetical protein